MANIENFNESAKNSNASLLKIFENSEFGKIRVALINGEPWFIGKDVAIALGYKYSANAVQDHVDEDDKKLIQLSDIQDVDKLSTFNHIKGSKIMIINESGLYSLIISSKLESAKRFKRWITSEVLPSIRKTGSYSINDKEEEQKPIPISKEEYELRMAEANAKIAEAKGKEADLQITKINALINLRERVPIDEYKQVVDYYLMEKVTGVAALPLPEVKENLYTATEIGEMFGITSNMVGRITNALNLKSELYSKKFFDKSKYSTKEVISYRYNSRAVDLIREYLNNRTDKTKKTVQETEDQLDLFSYER